MKKMKHLTFEEIKNTERYGDCNEVNYERIFEDIQKSLLKKYKRKTPEKVSACICGHCKSDHERSGKGECGWFNCKCKKYRITKFRLNDRGGNY